MDLNHKPQPQQPAGGMHVTETAILQLFLNAMFGHPTLDYQPYLMKPGRTKHGPQEVL